MSAAGTRRRTAVLLAASCHPGPALAVTVVAAVLSVGVGLSPGRTALLTAAVLAGQLSIGWSNDLIDRHRDRRAGRGDKPLAGDALPPAVVRVACGVALAACVVLSLALGALPGVVHLLGVACGWAYNLGLKATAWSWVPYAVAFGALAAVPSLAGGDGVAWWLPVVGALLGVGAHLVNVLPDLDDDAATGVRGLPHRIAARWGPAAVTRVAVLLFVTGTALLLVVVPASGARWVTAALVGLLAVTALRGSGRTPFRVAIAIALVDVALLAWAV